MISRRTAFSQSVEKPARGRSAEGFFSLLGYWLRKKPDFCFNPRSARSSHSGCMKFHPCSRTPRVEKGQHLLGLTLRSPCLCFLQGERTENRSRPQRPHRSAPGASGLPKTLHVGEQHTLDLQSRGVAASTTHPGAAWRECRKSKEFSTKVPSSMQTV